MANWTYYNLNKPGGKFKEGVQYLKDTMGTKDDYSAAQGALSEAISDFVPRGKEMNADDHPDNSHNYFDTRGSVYTHENGAEE